MMDGMPLALTCRGQAARAQSNAEAKVYAAAMCIKESIHAHELLGWIGEPVRIRLRMGAAAARSAPSRKGVWR